MAEEQSVSDRVDPHVQLQVAFHFKALPADFTAVASLLEVDGSVPGQRSAIVEKLPADVADVLLLLAVLPSVSRELRLHTERLQTNVTFERLVVLVDPAVSVQARLGSEGSAANVAPEPLVHGVFVGVTPQIAFGCEGLPTVRTPMNVLVIFQVFLQLSHRFDLLPAEAADVQLLVHMCPDVFDQTRQVPVPDPAHFTRHFTSFSPLPVPFSLLLSWFLVRVWDKLL